MAASAKSLMRAGLISPKAGAKLAVLRGTRAQKSKMTNFNHTEKDEARTRGEVPPNEINHPTNQRHGSRFMPSGKNGGASGFAAGKAMLRGSTTKEGGRVNSSYTPGRRQIDEFPQKQGSMRDRVSTFAASPTGAGAFPSGTNIGKRGGPVNPKSRGGKQAYRGNSYGAPNSRP